MLLVTGDANFDERLQAMSVDRERLGSVLTPEMRRLLLEQEAQKSPFWWRLSKGSLRGDVHGSWGDPGFRERCDVALRVGTTLAREIERPREAHPTSARG